MANMGQSSRFVTTVKSRKMQLMRVKCTVKKQKQVDTCIDLPDANENKETFLNMYL